MQITSYQRGLLRLDLKKNPKSRMAVYTFCDFTGQKIEVFVNPLSANPTKWSNTLTQFVGNLPTKCLSVFDHFVGLALKGLKLLQ